MRMEEQIAFVARVLIVSITCVWASDIELIFAG